MSKEHTSGSKGASFLNFDCGNCGKYALAQDTVGVVEDRYKGKLIPCATVSHEISKRQGDGRVMVDVELLETMSSTRLPTPADQMERLLLWMGDKLQAHGNSMDIDLDVIRARFGVLNKEALRQLYNYLHSENFVSDFGSGDVTMLLPGWEKYYELKKGHTDSMLGFMAMNFREETFAVYRNCFVPAAERAGFRLRTVNEDLEPKFIDDQIRVGIMNARFTVADLTYDNSGAYFEAGYAEGQNKPVFYTCEKEWFDNHGAHFDAEHQPITFWSPESHSSAGEQLTAMIRRTFPDIATMGG
jgi:hypothetical protein